MIFIFFVVYVLVRPISADNLIWEDHSPMSNYYDVFVDYPQGYIQDYSPTMSEQSDGNWCIHPVWRSPTKSSTGGSMIMSNFRLKGNVTMIHFEHSSHTAGSWSCCHGISFYDAEKANHKFRDPVYYQGLGIFDRTASTGYSYSNSVVLPQGTPLYSEVIFTRDENGKVWIEGSTSIVGYGVYSPTFWTYHVPYRMKETLQVLYETEGLMVSFGFGDAYSHDPSKCWKVRELSAGYELKVSPEPEPNPKKEIQVIFPTPKECCFVEESEIDSVTVYGCENEILFSPTGHGYCHSFTHIELESTKSCVEEDTSSTDSINWRFVTKVKTKLQHDGEGGINKYYSIGFNASLSITGGMEGIFPVFIHDEIIDYGLDIDRYLTDGFHIETISRMYEMGKRGYYELSVEDTTHTIKLISAFISEKEDFMTTNANVLVIEDYTVIEHPSLPNTLRVIAQFQDEVFDTFEKWVCFQVRVVTGSRRSVEYIFGAQRFLLGSPGNDLTGLMSNIFWGLGLILVVFFLCLVFVIGLLVCRAYYVSKDKKKESISEKQENVQKCNEDEVEIVKV